MQAVDGAEAHSRAQQTALKHVRRVGARVVGDQQRLPVNQVVDNLVPHEKSQGIGARVRAGGEHDDRVARIEEALGFLDLHKARRIDGRRAIAFKVVRAYLGKRNAGDLEARAPTLTAQRFGPPQIGRRGGY